MLTKKQLKRCNSLANNTNDEDFNKCDEEGDHLLHLAVVANLDIQIVSNFCNFIVNNSNKKLINCRNNLLQTPLHIACCIGNTSLVKVLLDFGADISSVDRNIENSIHLSVKYDHKSCLEILVSKCVQKNYILNSLNINGLSSLHMCVDCDHKSAAEMIKILVKTGADINVRDGLSGRTPLMYSLAYNGKQSHSIKKIILSLNADISLADFSGFRPIDIMQDNDFDVHDIHQKL